MVQYNPIKAIAGSNEGITTQGLTDYGDLKDKCYSGDVTGPFATNI